MEILFYIGAYIAIFAALFCLQAFLFDCIIDLSTENREKLSRKTNDFLTYCSMVFSFGNSLWITAYVLMKVSL